MGAFDPRVRCYQGDLPFDVFRSPRQFQQTLRNFEHVGAVIAQGHVLSNLKAGGGLPSVLCSRASPVVHGSRAARAKCQHEHHHSGQEGKDFPVHEHPRLQLSAGCSAVLTRLVATQVLKQFDNGECDDVRRHHEQDGIHALAPCAY